MAKTNVAKAKKAPIYTAEGARAEHITPIQQLRRLVMAHMLWEDSFYIDGVSSAGLVAEAVKAVPAAKVMEIAIEARNEMKLRHIPLFIVRTMAALPTHKHVVADTLEAVIQRADEIAEYMAIYNKDGRQPLSRQSKEGLARAFRKFSEYDLQKNDKDGALYKFRDVLFKVHAKPKESGTKLIVPPIVKPNYKRGAVYRHFDGQGEVWSRLVQGKLKIADTWETTLSAGKGKNQKADWERLIREKKLGGMAFIRNLRNMREAGVALELIKSGLKTLNVSKVLPFRFIAAAQTNPELEQYIEPIMLKAIEDMPKLPGRTVVVVDVSGSMSDPVSKKSKMSRYDAAFALAILARELCEDCVTIAFSSNAHVVPARRGFALRDAMKNTPGFGGGTYTETALIRAKHEGYDRIIVITDEQSAQNISGPISGSKAYFINVGIDKNGIGYHNGWSHFDGWSEAIIRYIAMDEGLTLEVDRDSERETED
jgi:hypothetical protein